MLRDLLMRLAMTGLFKAQWTEQIHEEWISALLRNKPGIDRKSLLRVKELMDRHSTDAVVNNYEILIEQLDLPDPDDRHVLAAAIKSNSDAIVTFNLKDFPLSNLKQYDIEAIHPDEFISYQFDLSPSKVCSAAKAMRASLRSPPFTEKEFIAALERNKLPITASLLNDYLEHI
ncbi:MAG: putative nucleic acid-binding protein [Cellvibrionaceae bacterium]